MKRRNCDIYQTYDKALAAFQKYCPFERGEKDATCKGCVVDRPFSCFGAWLLATDSEEPSQEQNDAEPKPTGYIYQPSEIRNLADSILGVEAAELLNGGLDRFYVTNRVVAILRQSADILERAMSEREMSKALGHPTQMNKCDRIIHGIDHNEQKAAVKGVDY